ncbi:DMT family transporter [Streptomyces sp. TRM70350]|uniref:DMT family transporter n=1 Tax=Streptomyces sp. TRM70350 TaxID=2856165 RepID=UPI0027E0D862|nr:DMT family transporter [Streptomyces sp. TRM70350]
MTTTRVTPTSLPTTAPATSEANPVRRAAVWLGPILAGVATLIWSGNFVIARALSDDIPPVQTAFWRWAIALVALAPFAAKGLWQHRRAIRAHAGYITVVGLLGITLFNTLIYIAGRTTSATNLALIAAASPVLIAVFAAIGGERLSRIRVLGMLLALVGVVALVAKGSVATLLSLDFAVGDLWMVAAMCTFAGYSALLKRKPKEIPAVVFLAATVLVGLVLLVPAQAVSLAVQGGFSPTGGNLSALAYIGVASSALAFFVWNKAVETIGATRAGVVYYLQPVCVSALAFLTIAEAPTPAQFACMGLIIAGVALSSARH